MTASLPPMIRFQPLVAGQPLPGGFVYFYAAGTTTPQAAYAADGTTPLANPLTLDANGACYFLLGDSLTYKIDVQDSTGAPVTGWPVDNVTSMNRVLSLFTQITDLASTSDVAKGDALVGVKKTATGAIATTQHLINETRVVDVVADYGADPTGATDSASKIQAAVTNNRNVYLPPGTYKLTDAISMPSNTRLFGAGASSILKAATDAMYVVAIGLTAARSGITLEDFAIDGGGQTSDIYTGVKAVTGVYASWCSNVRMNRITAYKLGVVNQSSPTVDVAYAGCGIDIQSNQGPVTNVRVTNCAISFVAGGGNGNGDCYNVTSPGTYAITDVVFDNCWASTCGRHSYCVAGTSGTRPSMIKFINCYAEKSALDGIDFEDGLNVLVDNCSFVSCGNDQTYFNPAVANGATYRLLAAIATSQPSNNITVTNCKFLSCYYGITEGGADGLTVSNCIFESSTVSDFLKGLAGGTTNMRLVNNRFGSALDTLSTNLGSAGSGFLALGCTFAGTVKITAMQDGIFQNCWFKKGWAAVGGSGGIARNKFLGCVFTDWAGPGIQCDSANYAHPDNIVQGCSFYGTGNMTNGIQFGNNSALRWQINGNTFEGMTTAGINQTLGNTIHAFDARGNSFRSMPIGININQGQNDTILDSNNFQGITNYCIYWASIAAAMNYSSIINNVVGASCTNGFTLSGTWDYCIVMGNNVHAASGTKWNVSGGQNANGVTANNITT